MSYQVLRTCCVFICIRSAAAATAAAAATLCVATLLVAAAAAVRHRGEISHLGHITI